MTVLTLTGRVIDDPVITCLVGGNTARFSLAVTGTENRNASLAQEDVYQVVISNPYAVQAVGASLWKGCRVTIEGAPVEGFELAVTTARLNVLSHSKPEELTPDSRTGYEDIYFVTGSVTDDPVIVCLPGHKRAGLRLFGLDCWMPYLPGHNWQVVVYHQVLVREVEDYVRKGFKINVMGNPSGRSELEVVSQGGLAIVSGSHSTGGGSRLA